jgi:hypothetical protein
MNIDKELARTQKKMTVARCKVQKAAATLWMSCLFIRKRNFAASIAQAKSNMVKVKLSRA